MSKNSYIFNFKKDTIGSPARFFLVVYCAALFLTLGAIFSPVFIALPAILRGELDAIDYDGLINEAPDEHWYLAYDFKGALDHDVFYYNFGKSIENARRADILILGNSRVQFSFHQRTLESFETRHGLKFYNMGLGHGEYYLFPLLIVERYDLNPKMVVVDAEAFNGRLTPFADHVISQGKVRRGLTFLIRSSFYKSILVLHSHLPERIRGLLLPTLRSNIYSKVMYRSRRTGVWFIPSPSQTFSASVPIRNTMENDCMAGPQALENAQRLKDAMAKKGIQIVLTLVPHNGSCRNAAEKIAAFIQAPIISVDWHGMDTRDGSHLIEESAKRFTREFLRDLEKSEPFLDLVSKIPAK